MAFEFSDHTTDSGFAYLRMASAGHTRVEDVDEILRQLQMPGREHGMVLSVASGASQDSEARERFADLTPHFNKMAVVVTRPIARAMINMMLRLNPSSRSKIRLFGTEAEGLAWLEAE